MKILITGANGYLGSGIVKKLLDNGCDVIAADFDLSNVDNRAQKMKCNLFEIKNPYQYFDEPDCLLHLAWRDGFVHFSEHHIKDFPLHFEFIRKMAEAGIKKISVMGTMHEIGFIEGSIDETTPCNPQSYYGIAKNALREATQLLAQQNNNVFQWLRGFYIVGNSVYGASIFSKISQAVEKGQKEFPFTMGLNQYDFLDYEEFCDQVAATVQQDEVNGIINICSGRPEKLADRVERYIRDNKFDIKLKYGVYPDRIYDSKAVWGNNDKIQQILKNAE